jgi:hypothetical protein
MPCSSELALRLMAIMWYHWEGGRNPWDLLSEARSVENKDDDSLVLAALKV